MTHQAHTSAVCTTHRWNDMPIERLSDQVGRRFIAGENIMLAHVYLEKGCVVPQHSHVNEQMSYILEGALHFAVGENGIREFTVHAGEVAHIPSNIPHRVTAIEKTLSVDVFSPPRQDWIDKTDAYLRG